MHAESLIFFTYQHSVHTQEIMRRLLNSSPLLDWKTNVAPVISKYMLCMRNSGYPEKYRVDTVNRALIIYDRMVGEDADGTRQLFRPK